MRLAVSIVALALCSTALAAEPAGGAAADDPAGPAVQALSPEERAEVRELLALTHALDIGEMFSKVIVDQMSETLKSARPDLPARAFDLVADEVNATIAAELRSEGGFADSLVALYRRHFTREEIQALVAFYKTPLGRKLSDKLPTLGQEGMAVGAKWGERLGPKVGERVVKRLQREGIQL
ncbi:DUF2059 domain-containing protein [Anaeromyxobacter dehalogenans]|uniref:DUF2059 domain-containing protein n=1 Tax=Anaeromyxobacter dehalogenans (strain 2CP-C) TaxID=290397 RepID=Q2IIS9_ANADE|nr:DUF2059 domain-containing protein [Anaeromyxobacter dehalogenans]ABC81560.1 hypothetical protein Adeh_1787 [Anaeromyxobacter dehalogenans 2CP-C]